MGLLCASAGKVGLNIGTLLSISIGLVLGSVAKKYRWEPETSMDNLTGKAAPVERQGSPKGMVSLGMPLVPCRLTRSVIQNAINRCPADSESTRDIDRADPISPQRRNLSGSCPCCWLPAFVFAFGLCLGDTFPLPFEHQFALEAGDSADDREHQPPGRCAGISEIQNAEVGPLGFHAFGNFQEMLG